MNKLLCCLLALIALSGCQPISHPVRQLHSQTSLPKTAELNKIIENAVDCKEQLHDKQAICPGPARANHIIDKNFKYGRFCGKNFPEISDLSGINEANLTADQRKEIAKKYYGIKPIDDIDKACQLHDICWLINGKKLEKCNYIFKNSLDNITERFRSQVDWWLVNDNYQSRCAELAMDMSMSTFFFESEIDDKDLSIANGISKIIVSPITLMYAGVFYASSLEDNYPHSDERCWVDKAEKERFLQWKPRRQNAIGLSMDEEDHLQLSNALEFKRTGEQTSWTNRNTGNYYTVTPTRTYKHGKSPCRDYTVNALTKGRKSEKVYDTACRSY